MSVLRKEWVLILDSLYRPIGTISIQKALVSIFSSKDGQSVASKALDLEYELDKDGHVDFMKPVKMIPLSGEDWVNSDLPLRDYDVPIHTINKVIRAPIVIMAVNYSKMNFRKLKPSKKNLYEVYGGKCVWTGRHLSYNEASVEHLEPRKSGGQNSWKNLAVSDRKLNNQRGHTPLNEWKYKQQYQTKEPIAKPAFMFITKPVRLEWSYFLLQL